MRKLFPNTQIKPPPMKWDSQSIPVQLPDIPELGAVKARRLSNIIVSMCIACLAVGLGFLIVKFRATMMQPQYMLMGLLAMGSMGNSVYNKVKGTASKSGVDTDTDRKIFDAELAETRSEVNSTRAQHYHYETWFHPHTDDLVGMAGTRRQWERRWGSVDTRFGCVRFGIGDVLSASQLQIPYVSAAKSVDPYIYTNLIRFVDTFRVEARWPYYVNLFTSPHMFLYGKPENIQNLVNSIIGQLAFFHLPEDMKIVIILGSHSVYDFEYTLWLPHCLHPTLQDKNGPLRLHYRNQLDFLINNPITERDPWKPGFDSSERPMYVILNFSHYESWMTLLPQGAVNTVVIHVNPTTPLPAEHTFPQYSITDTDIFFSQHNS